MQVVLVYLETNEWKCLQCIIIHLVVDSRVELGRWVMSHEQCLRDVEVRMMKQSQTQSVIEKMLESICLKVK